MNEERRGRLVAAIGAEELAGLGEGAIEALVDAVLMPGPSPEQLAAVTAVVARPGVRWPNYERWLEHFRSVGYWPRMWEEIGALERGTWTADRAQALDGLPEEWRALHVLPIEELRRVAAAYGIRAQSKVALLQRLHEKVPLDDLSDLRAKALAARDRAVARLLIHSLGAREARLRDAESRLSPIRHICSLDGKEACPVCLPHANREVDFTTAGPSDLPPFHPGCRCHFDAGERVTARPAPAPNATSRAQPPPSPSAAPVGPASSPIVVVGGAFIALCFGIACLSALSGLHRALTGPSASDPASYELVYTVTGPGTCEATVDMNDSSAERVVVRLPWRSAARSVHFGRGVASPHAELRVYLPPSCPTNPEELSCTVLRNGAPWGAGQGWIAAPTRWRGVAQVMCSISGDLRETTAPVMESTINDMQRQSLAAQRADVPVVPAAASADPGEEPTRRHRHRHH